MVNIPPLPSDEQINADPLSTLNDLLKIAKQREANTKMNLESTNNTLEFNATATPSFSIMLAKTLGFCIQESIKSKSKNRVSSSAFKGFIYSIYEDSGEHSFVLDWLVRDLLLGTGLLNEASNSSYQINEHTLNFSNKAEVTYKDIQSLEKYNYHLTYRLSEVFTTETFDEKEFNSVIYAGQDEFLNSLIQDIEHRIKANLNYKPSDNVISPILDNLDDEPKLNEHPIPLPTEIELPLADRILLRIKALTPTQFEHFAPNLIKSIYDDNDEFVTTHNGQVGDGGIDATLKVKKKIGAGYDEYFIQCKRYDTKSIGRPELNSFIGALVGKKAKNGIFITTSYFTKDAKSYIESLSDHHIELIDGDNLVQKIIEHKLGIKEIPQQPIFEIDEGFFGLFADK